MIKVSRRHGWWTLDSCNKERKRQAEGGRIQCSHNGWSRRLNICHILYGIYMFIWHLLTTAKTFHANGLPCRNVFESFRSRLRKAEVHRRHNKWQCSLWHRVHAGEFKSDDQFAQVRQMSFKVSAQPFGVYFPGNESELSENDPWGKLQTAHLPKYVVQKKATFTAKWLRVFYALWTKTFARLSF